MSSGASALDGSSYATNGTTSLASRRSGAYSSATRRRTDGTDRRRSNANGVTGVTPTNGRASREARATTGTTRRSRVGGSDGTTAATLSALTWPITWCYKTDAGLRAISAARCIAGMSTYFGRGSGYRWPSGGPNSNARHSYSSFDASIGRNEANGYSGASPRGSTAPTDF